MTEQQIGTVSEFFARPVVAGIELTSPLRRGDRIHVLGHTTDFIMTVDSIQINSQNVEDGKPGEAVGIRVPDRVRKGDAVYKVTA
jgi:putative protease